MESEQIEKPIVKFSYECLNCNAVHTITDYNNLRCQCGVKNFILLSYPDDSNPPMYINEYMEKIKVVYEGIIDVANFYMDIDPKLSKLISLWVIGTYCYKEFPTYPILYLNAIRGAGKSRMENFISYVAWNGLLLNNITESVMFRNAGKHTLIIDELESIMKKEKQTLRELLNSAYKRGTTVQRMRKVKTKESEGFEVESFDLYCPIVIANINGMNEVTQDRCIPVILEKSVNPLKVKLIENFSDNEQIKTIKGVLDGNKCSLCMYLRQNNVLKKWNDYISHKYTNTLYTLTTLSTLNAHITKKDFELFEKIDKLNITGRNLELFFPIIILASTLDESILDELLSIVKEYTTQKIKFEIADSPDIALYKHISEKNYIEWYSINDLTNEFKAYFNADNNQDRDWLNNHWMGRALRRLNLMKQSRRTSRGMEVILDINKAKQKTEMFNSMEVKV